MKRSVLKSYLKNEIRQIQLEVDLTKDAKSVAGYLERNMKKLEPLVSNKARLKQTLEKDFEGLHVSDDYVRKFFIKLDDTKGPVDTLSFLYNTLLAGAGLSSKGF